MNTIRGNIGDLAENQQEHEGGEYGLYKMPERSKYRLFILGYEIPFHKEEQEIAVSPYFFEVQVEQPGFGPDNEIPVFFGMYFGRMCDW